MPQYLQLVGIGWLRKYLNKNQNEICREWLTSSEVEERACNLEQWVSVVEEVKVLRGLWRQGTSE
jgi:hypothetical protein